MGINQAFWGPQGKALISWPYLLQTDPFLA